MASIDQGTSSSRVMIFDREGSVVAAHQLEHAQHFPQPGWVEHDPLEIWDRVADCVSESMRKAHLSASDICALGITNQRETTVVWNRSTGKPYHNAIVWNDTRTADICDRLAASLGGKDALRRKTGLPIASYFSASKLIYLLETIPGLRDAAMQGDALFGTIDTWLMFKLTCGKVHATDVTNASRTLLMNIETLQWDEEILRALKIPRAMLPEIRSSSEVLGRTLSLDELMGVPIAGVLGDQQAALFGQTCFGEGDAKCTYGTGAFLLLNTGSRCVQSTNGLLTTVAYQLGKNQPPTYALEGSVAYCGSLIQWLRDNMEFFNNVAESENILMAKNCKDNGGLYFVPAFSGLYAPYWRSDARGVIVGITAYNTKAHFIRAALEAAAFQAKEVLDAMELDSMVKVRSLRVDGGMTHNSTAMQFQCDLVNVPLRSPKIAEMTALGAAYVAGLAVGYWTSQDDLRSAWQEGRKWESKMQCDERNSLMLHWRKAVARSLNWASPGKKADGGCLTEEEADPHLELLPSRPSTSARGQGKFSMHENRFMWAAAALAVGFVAGIAAARVNRR